jgi:hypothetical protein
MTIEPYLMSHRPPWRAGSYPSIVECLRGARWITTQGQTVPKREVSAKEPKHVKHAIDALRYAVRDLDDSVQVYFDAGGSKQVADGYIPDCTPYGDRSIFG